MIHFLVLFCYLLIFSSTKVRTTINLFFLLLLLLLLLLLIISNRVIQHLKCRSIIFCKYALKKNNKVVGCVIITFQYSTELGSSYYKTYFNILVFRYVYFDICIELGASYIIALFKIIKLFGTKYALRKLKLDMYVA